jgi:hypothetical protein
MEAEFDFNSYFLDKLQHNIIRRHNVLTNHLLLFNMSRLLYILPILTASLNNHFKNYDTTGSIACFMIRD